MEGLCYLCSKKKDVDQLCGFRTADLHFVFTYANSRFSHDVTHIIKTKSQQ